MKKLLKEPLFHFLSIGAFLFLLYGLLNPQPTKNEISIDDNLINELTAKWELQRNRQPTLEELVALVDQYVEQELFYQEALAMNLDHNDEIVKRRLAQKMEFISNNMSETLQPTKEILKSYYDEHKENYKKPSYYSLKQVFFNEDRKSAKTDALQALKSESPESQGDQTILPAEYINESSLKIGSDFGSMFEAALDSLPINKWVGPLRSGYGFHLIYISERKTPGYYSFEDVREKVGVDYNFDATNDFKESLIASLLKSYSVNLEIGNKDLKTALDKKY